MLLQLVAVVVQVMQVALEQAVLLGVGLLQLHLVWLEQAVQLMVVAATHDTEM
jgi:hypothetical protein